MPRCALNSRIGRLGIPFNVSLSLVDSFMNEAFAHVRFLLFSGYKRTQIIFHLSGRNFSHHLERESTNSLFAVDRADEAESRGEGATEKRKRREISKISRGKISKEHLHELKGEDFMLIVGRTTESDCSFLIYKVLWAWLVCDDKGVDDEKFSSSLIYDENLMRSAWVGFPSNTKQPAYALRR